MLNRVISRFPNGTLWQLNRKSLDVPLSCRMIPILIPVTGAKLARYQRRPDDAIEIIETNLKIGSAFREADSLLVFEVSRLFG